MACISDIKLIRTDTTLDLSQKAEKNTATRSALERRSPTHIYICALVASAPVALAPARTPSAHASVHTERPTTPPTGDPPRHGQRQRPAPARPPLHLRLLFLIVYALHNAWNCWTFLNFSNFEPAKALLAATNEQVGFITTVGWLGICSTLPVVALCSWQRALLIVACLANALAPVVRYFAASACYHDGGYDALACSYTLVALSNYVQGAAFGVLGAWPSLLGAQWPQVLPLTVPYD